MRNWLIFNNLHLLILIGTTTSLWAWWRTTPFILYQILPSLAPLDCHPQVSCWYCSSTWIMCTTSDIHRRGPKVLTQPLPGRLLVRSLTTVLLLSSGSAEMIEYLELPVSCQFLHCNCYFYVWNQAAWSRTHAMTFLNSLTLKARFLHSLHQFSHL